ncbi:MAG: hypothetical protein KAH32_07185 [Chlamydiia bacterium]|nr:hypothetical protein [Chlamydiia bacterium]
MNENSKVMITPTKEGNLVTPYAGNPEFGYVMLSQTTQTVLNGWMKDVTNRTIIKGAVASLESFVGANSNLQLPGKLVVKEYLEDAVPQHVAKAHFDSDLSHEEQISNYIKRAGEEGPELKVDDKRILRFILWDVEGSDGNITLQHSNVDEVVSYNKANKKTEAKL